MRALFLVELQHEENGRWTAEIETIQGCIVTADTDAGAVTAAEVLALRVLADRLKHDELLPEGVEDHLFVLYPGKQKRR